jgi:large subunit ribosomal protein L15
MELNAIRNEPGARRRKKRVGCGESSGHGKTCCRGNKGQMSRSGHKRKPGFEGGQMKLARRLPKRGFVHASKEPYAAVNLSGLGRFPAGSEVTVEALLGAGLVREAGRRVKILGDGEPAAKLAVKAHAFSASARAKIEAAGGTCEIVND